MSSDPTNVIFRRVVAFIIDSIAILAIDVGIFFLLAKKTSEKPTASVTVDIYSGDTHYVLSGGKAGLFYAITVGVGLIYFVVIQGRTGATLGKARLGIRVVVADGGVPGMWRAFVRGFLWIIDGLFFYLVGLITAIVSKRHQRVGDMVASTYVVRRDAAGRPVPVAGQPISPAAPPTPPAAPPTPA